MPVHRTGGNAPPEKGQSSQTVGKDGATSLIAGKGHNKIRMVVPSMKAIRDKWPIHSGRICVKILWEGEALPSGLQAVVDAAGPDSFI